MRRQAIVNGARESATESLISHLLHLHGVGRSSSVGLFVADDGEPDLRPLVRRLWDRGAQVALPVLHDDPADYSMRFIPWKADDTLVPGRYEIPIPPPRPPIEPEVLLVSFVGFDAVGNRMGRGGGFFDRYLASTSASVIGVGFEVQRFESIPVQAHDQPLPTVVTDHGVRHLPVPNSTQLRGILPAIGKDGQPCV